MTILAVTCCRGLAVRVAALTRNGRCQLYEASYLRRIMLALLPVSPRAPSNDDMRSRLKLVMNVYKGPDNPSSLGS